ncbi:META domain-containing protein [Leifsonia poae]|uniref:META domain-containing protein n=1 Tax=Leifsonia poae TaxID=110933 RepID=UPI001CBB796B|nr:META domain-containing protein [Leifsonia poae]
MKIVRTTVLVLAIAAAASLTGCAANSPSASPTPTASADSSVSVFVGSWGDDAQGQPSLTIAADGAFNGSDGCNAMAGKATFVGDKLEFGPFASTLVACEGVHPWLSLASTATVSGDTLTVFKADGDKIGTLAKR